MLYFLNNHQVYHGRGNWSVTDNESSGDWGNSGRLLFRTWISPYNSRPLPDTDEYRNVWGSVEGGKARGGWDQAVKTGDSPKPSIPADHKYYSLFDDRVQVRARPRLLSLARLLSPFFPTLCCPLHLSPHLPHRTSRQISHTAPLAASLTTHLSPCPPTGEVDDRALRRRPQVLKY